MPNFVQLYKSTDTNAPILTGQSGSLITLLNKCLVDGYTPASVSSITRVGTTATVTLAVPNTTLITGNFVTISGAAQSDYNGSFQITVLSSTQFTYTVANNPVTPATGTILYAKSPLGWTRPFAAGTNSQTYRSADNTSNQFYLQVIDDATTVGGGREAQVYGAEVMIGDQAVSSGRFPTLTQYTSLCWMKSPTTDATTRRWLLVGDSKTFYIMFPDNIVSKTYDRGERMYGFGHFVSYKPGDAYNTFICGDTAFPGINYSTTSNCAFGFCMGWGFDGIIRNGLFFARSYTQSTGAVAGNIFSIGYSGPPGNPNPNVFLATYPNFPDTGAYTVPITAWETGVVMRGRFPGLYAPVWAAYNTHAIFDRITLNNPSTLNLITMGCSSGGSAGVNCGRIFVDMGLINSSNWS